MNSVPVGFAPSGDVFVVPAKPTATKKKPPLQFDELGNVILPPGALDPSDTTLLARAMVLQGQEARASTDALLNTSIATPEELMAFVGGRSDLSTADILQAKTVMRSAADLRKEVSDTAEMARDQQDIIQQAIEDADAAAQKAAADAAVAADRVATGIDGLTAATAPVPVIAPAAPPAPPAPPGGPVPGGMPVYAAKSRTQLVNKAQGALTLATTSPDPAAAAGAQIQADIALAGIAAYDNLFAIGFFREVLRSAKSRPLTSAEKTDMLTVNKAMQAAGVKSVSDKFNRVMSEVLAETRTGATSAAAAKQAADNAAVIAAQAAALKKAAEDRAAAAAAAAAAGAAKAKAEAVAKAKAVADAQAASMAAVAAQAKAKADADAAAAKAKATAAAGKPKTPKKKKKGGMTGSGLDWREIGALAMDKAEAGDQVGALRLLADATDDGVVFPDGKISKLYTFVRSRF